MSVASSESVSVSILWLSFACLGNLQWLLAESLSFRLFLRILKMASLFVSLVRSTDPCPVLKRSNIDVGGLFPSLSFAGLVLWASRISLFVSPTLCLTGVLLTVSSKTTLLGGVCWTSYWSLPGVIPSVSSRTTLLDGVFWTSSC